MSDETRVRIAPSPSGNLHIGTARTALFNFLFAKKTGGKFVLRIEDTDLERSNNEYVKNIFDSLKALGLNWDEGPDIGGDFGPYAQSERFDIYPKYAQMLLDRGFAYECFCTPDELEKEKEDATANKQAYVYSKKCANLTRAEKEALTTDCTKPAIRFSVSSVQKAFHGDNNLCFNDMVKSVLHQDTSLIGDFVIMKSNGTPTYNFAVVVDDMLMKITHVIRGEDHISNTFKQILLYEALGAQVPQFGHLGMILAPDRSKLSKRHGATAVSDFVKQGYLTDALVNFVALLGWAPSDGEEIKTVDEIADDFDITKISSSNSIFEYDKLNWMNGQYIKKMPLDKLYDYIMPHLAKYDTARYTKAQMLRLIEVTREPLTVLSEITHDASFFFENEISLAEVQDVINSQSAKIVLPYVLEDLKSWDFNSEEQLHEKLNDIREYFKANHSIKAKDTMWAIRAALTGRTRGADICAVISLLGKDTVEKRIKKAAYQG
jgi:glutamyl-tRNA synthetase